MSDHGFVTLPPLNSASASNARPGDIATIVTRRIPLSGAETQANPTVTIGGFILERHLGSGAMGEVHLARHQVSGQIAAIKFITDARAVDPAFVQRFVRECALVSQLDHPNIAKAYAHGIDNGRPFLAMEYVPGCTLAESCAGRRMDQATALHIAIQIARGLQHAFIKYGLVHRDIKPGNIIIVSGERGDDLTKIIDFGLAKPESTADNPQLTLAGIVLGTPHYMSPEQIRADPNLTFSADLYSLGATLFHLVTGQLPFVRSSPAEVMSAHLRDEVPDPGDVVPGLHPLFRALIRRCLAKAPAERYPDYRTFIMECGKTLSSLGVRLEGTVRIVRHSLIAESTGTVLGTSPAPRSLPVLDSPDGQTVIADLSPTAETSANSSRDASSYYSPTTRENGTDPLLLRPGRTQTPRRYQSGSEALRQLTTSKYARLRTTRRTERQHRQAEELFAPDALKYTPLERPDFTQRTRAILPWMALGGSLIGLLWKLLIDLP